MKPRRHQRILEIIRNGIVETQEQLAANLAADGIKVTQATVSRDLKELQLIKVPVGDGRYRYVAPVEKNAEDMNKRIERMLRDNVVSLEDSENLLVVKTLEGAAQGVAAVLDDLNWPDVVGTIAGDDTIFVVVKPREAVPNVMNRLNKLRR